MSLYGKVKKVGSSTFQFDRVYSNRAAMEAQMNEDGVYAGRYVLVEYGQRYGLADGTNNNASSDVTLYNGQDNEIVENAEYLRNKQADLTKYGAIYDSTVWQKIYTSEGDKYIMVAELNAVVPQLDLIKDSPLHYDVPEDSTHSSKVYVADGLDVNGKIQSIKPVSNVEETYNQAHFDEHVDTESSYQLHIPKPVELDVNNDNVNIHEHGFDMAYSFGTDDSQTAVGWVTDGLTVNEDGSFSGGPIDKDSKTLYMNMPAFGNVMNTLYDLLYGKPKGDLTDGALRPYFERYISSDEELTMKVTVQNSNGQWVPLQTNYLINSHRADPERVPYDYKTVTGKIGSHVPIGVAPEEFNDFKAEINNAIIPNNIILVVDDGEGNYTRVNSDTEYVSGQIKFAYNRLPMTADNIIDPIITNTGINDIDRSWMSKVPGLSDLLENNTAGLATILQSLFGYADPFTGTTRYYLYTDWQTEESADSSIPAIQNKPEIVGGYDTVTTNRTNNYTCSTEDPLPEGEPNTIVEPLTTIDYMNWSNGDYAIDYDSWLVQDYVQPVDFLAKFNIVREAEPAGEITLSEWSQQPLTKTYRTRNWSLTPSFEYGNTAPVQNQTTGLYEAKVKINITLSSDSFDKGGGWTKTFCNNYKIGTDLKSNFVTFFTNEINDVENASVTQTLWYTLSSNNQNDFRDVPIPIYMIGNDQNSPSENDVIKLTFFRTVTQSNSSTNTQTEP